MNEKFLNILIKECKKAFKKDEVPIACIITKNNKIVSKSHNLKHKTNFILNHAEVLAIKKAAKKNKDWRLNGYDMYVTLEPCPMCTGAIIQSRISKLIIGTFNKDMGACGSVVNLIDNRNLNSFVEVVWSYDERCGNLLMDFFYAKRNEKFRREC